MSLCLILRDIVFVPLCAFSVKLTIIQCYFVLWLDIQNLTNHNQLLGKMVNQFFRTECFILFIQLSLVYLLYCYTCSGMKGTLVYNFDDSFKSVQTFGNFLFNKFNNCVLFRMEAKNLYQELK